MKAVMPYQNSLRRLWRTERAPANTRPAQLLAWSILLAIGTIQTVCMGAEPITRTQVVHATYRIGVGKSTASCWIVSSSDPTDQTQQQLHLVTAAHVLEKMDGNEATLVARTMSGEGKFARTPKTIVLRENGKPLWTKHSERDVAVLTLEMDPDLRSVPLEALAAEADWAEQSPEPGDLVRCVGFPHAAHFDPSPAAFPLVRLGCLASYPLQPLPPQATFLVDFNTFEGDSGGPVLLENTRVGRRALKIIGLVSAQHFIDEKYDLIYAKGHIRKRLGLSIIVHSQIILDTIRLSSADES